MKRKEAGITAGRLVKWCLWENEHQITYSVATEYGLQKVTSAGGVGSYIQMVTRCSLVLTRPNEAGLLRRVFL